MLVALCKEVDVEKGRSDRYETTAVSKQEVVVTWRWWQEEVIRVNLGSKESTYLPYRAALKRNLEQCLDYSKEGESRTVLSIC